MRDPLMTPRRVYLVTHADTRSNGTAWAFMSKRNALAHARLKVSQGFQRVTVHAYAHVSAGVIWRSPDQRVSAAREFERVNRPARTQAEVRERMESIGPIPSAMASADAKPYSGAKCAACDGYGVVNKTTGQVCAICHCTGIAPTTGGK